MTAIRILVHALLRAGVIGLGLVGYDLGYDQLVPGTPGDADIGKGLLAFLLIGAASLAWGLYDGFRLRPLVWAVAWLVAALLVGVGWELVGADAASDVEWGLVLFTGQLIAVPALVGAALTMSRRARPAPAPEAAASAPDPRRTP